MTKSDETGKKTTHYCPICQQTGFHNGEICSCITGKKPENVPDLPEGWDKIFGDIFKPKTHNDQ
jgi:hypothetical protein